MTAPMMPTDMGHRERHRLPSSVPDRRSTAALPGRLLLLVFSSKLFNAPQCVRRIVNVDNLGVVFLSEVVGTALLVLLGCGVVANVALTRNKGFNGGFLMVTIGGGLAV